MRQQGMKVLYSAEERVAILSYAGSPGETGWLRIVEPEEPTEFEAVVAEDILKHTEYLGLVEVEVIKTKKGTEYNLEKAEEDSKALLATTDEKRLMTWVQDMVDDYIKRNKPVPPPSEAIVRVMQRRNFDPQRFGITPFGWDDPLMAMKQKDAAHEQERKDWKDRFAQMEAQIALLSKQVAGQGK